MAHVDVLADGLEAAPAAGGGVDRLVADGGRQLAVRGQVGVPPDRRGEVRVDLAGEAVVAEFGVRLGARAEVLGRHHAARGHDADEGVEEGLLGVDAGVETVGERAGRVDAEVEVALDAELVGELVKIGLGGCAVAAEDGGLGEGLVDLAGDADVGEKHKLFD